MFSKNLLLSVDSYKNSHFKMLAPNVKYVYSYLESRGGDFDKVMFFGLQMYLKEYLATPITQENIEEAAEIYALHGVPFNRKGWEIIVNEFGGKLPLSIWAIPEGTIIAPKNALVTIVNTDPRFPWLPGFIETSLLRGIWYPTIVGTLSWTIKQDIREALEKSCDDPEGQLAFRLHDFAGRSVSSGESASIGGVAHLVNFMGTDTVEALVAARRYYNESMAGFSIPASEHSVTCSFGLLGEKAAYEYMLDAFNKPNTIMALVADTYDLENAVKNIFGKELRDRIINSGGTLVVRPDSGDPMTVPVEVVKMLAEEFGYTYNKKGYRVLPSYVRVIQGDGVNRQSILVIMKNLMDAGYSVENLAFGMGGALLQIVNRDMLRFAMKASAVSEDGIVWEGIAKNPKTDPNKRSKMGRLSVIPTTHGFGTVAYGHELDILEPIWLNGELLIDRSLSEIRERSNKR